MPRNVVNVEFVNLYYIERKLRQCLPAHLENFGLNFSSSSFVIFSILNFVVYYYMFNIFPTFIFPSINLASMYENEWCRYADLKVTSKMLIVSKCEPTLSPLCQHYFVMKSTECLLILYTCYSKSNLRRRFLSYLSISIDCLLSERIDCMPAQGYS